jgi:hypothetical protein
MKIANFRPKVKGDTIKGIIIPFNVPVSELHITFQVRSVYTDALLYEATTGNGIVEYDAKKALIEKFETDDFKIGEHPYEIKVQHIAENWDKVVYRGKFPIVKNIIKE